MLVSIFRQLETEGYQQFYLRPVTHIDVIKQAGGMADAGQFKKNAAKALSYVEKFSSFASSIDPIFGIVSSLVGVARKGLLAAEGNDLDKDFQEINTKLENISRENQKCLQKIRVDEVNETYGKYEEYIKHQYAAFNTMVDCVKNDPDNIQRHMDDFKKVYERDKSDLGLDLYYRGVMNRSLFGRPLLHVYMESCDRNSEIMEYHCSHISHLFHMGLITLMAYTAITEDNEKAIRDKWTPRVHDIQKEMQEVMKLCSPPLPEGVLRGQK